MIPGLSPASSGPFSLYKEFDSDQSSVDVASYFSLESYGALFLALKVPSGITISGDGALDFSGMDEFSTVLLIADHHIEAPGGNGADGGLYYVASVLWVHGGGGGGMGTPYGSGGKGYGSAGDGEDADAGGPGSGGSSYWSPAPDPVPDDPGGSGTDGGDAIVMGCRLFIDVTNGHIYAGGGGGDESSPYTDDPGYDGGDWGENAPTGGSGGKAVDLNGLDASMLTWLGGYPANVKGDIS